MVNGREICRATLRHDVYVFGSPSSTMIRSDRVRARNPFYDERYFHADAKVCFELLRDSDFGFVHQVLTYSRVHDESQTAKVAHRYGTMVAEPFAMLLEHGPFYCEPDEYQALLRTQLRQYYRFLIKRLFTCRKDERKEFWTYHLEQLRRAGYPPSAFKLADALLWSIANLFLRSRRAVRGA